MDKKDIAMKPSVKSKENNLYYFKIKSVNYKGLSNINKKYKTTQLGVEEYMS